MMRTCAIDSPISRHHLKVASKTVKQKTICPSVLKSISVTLLSAGQEGMEKLSKVNARSLAERMVGIYLSTEMLVYVSAYMAPWSSMDLTRGGTKWYH